MITLLELAVILRSKITEAEYAAEEYIQELNDQEGCDDKLSKASAYKEILDIIEPPMPEYISCEPHDEKACGIVNHNNGTASFIKLKE